MVLEHDDALDLGLEGSGLGGLVTLVEVGLGRGGIDVGILEQAAVEVAQKQALGDLAEVGLGLLLAQGLLHRGVGVLQDLGVVAAAHLVDADLDGLGGTLGGVPHVVVLEAPAGPREDVGVFVVLENGPVGAGRALEAVLLAQEVLDLVLREAGADQLTVLAVLGPGDGVGGHDGGGALGLAVELEGAVDEGDRQRGEVVAGVDGVLAAVGVALAAALARALGRPVLDHGQKRAGAPALVLALVVEGGLQAVDVGADHVAGQRGVDAEGAGETGPTRVGGDVGLRAEVHGDAHLAHVAGDAGAGGLGDLGVEGGSEAQVIGPVGAVLALARVGREVDGDLVGGSLGVGLHVVGPGGLLEGGEAGGGVQDRAHAAVQELLLGVGDGAVVLDLGLVTGEAHEAGDLVHSHAAGQVLGALLGGKAPVLVGDELAGALEVLEGVAVDLDELQAGVLGVGQLLAVAVVDDHVAVAGVGLGVAGALGGGLLLLGVAAGQRQQARGEGAAGDEAATRDIHALPCHECPFHWWFTNTKQGYSASAGQEPPTEKRRVDICC